MEWNETILPMLCGSLDGKRVWGRMDTCICMAKSLCCSPETITTALPQCHLSYQGSPTEDRKRRERQRRRWWDGITNAMELTWANSGRWWGTGRPGMLQSTGLRRVRHYLGDWIQIYIYIVLWIRARQEDITRQNEDSSVIQNQTYVGVRINYTVKVISSQWRMNGFSKNGANTIGYLLWETLKR